MGSSESQVGTEVETRKKRRHRVSITQWKLICPDRRDKGHRDLLTRGMDRQVGLSPSEDQREEKDFEEN